MKQFDVGTLHIGNDCRSIHTCQKAKRPEPTWALSLAERPVHLILEQRLVEYQVSAIRIAS